MKKTILFIFMAILSIFVSGQVGINNSFPKATLDVTAKKTDGSTSEGIIAPRLTGEQLHTADGNGVYGQLQDGTLAFVTTPPSVPNRIGQTIDIDARGYYYYDYPKNKWIKVIYGGNAGTVLNIDCGNAVTTGILTAGTVASGVSVQVPYTGGNGGTYPSQFVNSTGVTGLTANLVAGTFSNGSGTLNYTITGTPSGAGVANFVISLGGQSCTLNIPIGNNNAVITALNCGSASTTGSLNAGVPASGVSVNVPYTGGNGASYPSQSIASTGVMGLIANLAPGTLSNGLGNLHYTITGTPSASGTANFSISFGGQSCTLSLPVNASLPKGSGSFGGMTCFDVVMANDGGECGTLSSRQSQKADFIQNTVNTQTYTFRPAGTVSNVRFIYINTNGQVIQSIIGGNAGNNITSPQTVTVKYNTNLNALASGTTRADALTANVFVIYNNSSNNTGADMQLSLKVSVQDCMCCGAYTATGVWREFMCQNLGADMSADPFTPSAIIHGAKYQWGAQTGETGRYYSQAEDQANSGPISLWASSVTDLAWQDGIKTAKDPCPPGYRVPTSSEWNQIGNATLNPSTVLGTWTNSPDNYSSGIKVGNNLFLPAAGARYGNGFPIFNRGSQGFYWTTTQSSEPLAYYLSFTVNGVMGTPNGVNFGRKPGMSVRCISE